MKNLEAVLFDLISFGLDERVARHVPWSVDWECLWKMAIKQGVSSICLDGLQRLEEWNDGLTAIPKPLKMRWIASVMKQEQAYHGQWEAAKALAELYGKHGVDTYVLKGFSLSRFYPMSEHRPCTDMDCYLKGEYEEGNRIARENGLTVDCSYYKHSKILLRGLTVENHQFLLPIKGSGKAKRFERELRSWIDNGRNDYIGDSQLKATSPFFDVVYVLAHAQEHFLNEGIILRHICDWAMVLKAHGDTVDWNEWKRVCEVYGMLAFGYAMSRLACRICGVSVPFNCPKDDDADRRLLEDTLYRKNEGNGNRSDMQVRIEIGNTVCSRTLIRSCFVEDVCGGIYLIKTWINMMIFKRLFDIIASFCGLLLIWWIFPIIAFLIHKKMPGGPAFFCQKRVGKNGKLFTCHKFRSMTVKHNGSTVSVAGDSRITPFGAKLRHYKLDELPGLWDVLIGNMSFVGPRPDVPRYADKLQGDDRDVLKLRPGITGPATLKYRLEDEMISEYVAKKQAEGDERPMQEIATEYNDNVIYPDKVRLNCYYYRHYSFWKDIEMIFATVLGFKVKFAGEEV